MDKKKVVGYARIGRDGVFTGMIHTQIELIRATVANHPDWELGVIYTDEGMSVKQKRYGFEQMLNDAEMHQFDCIVVKDMSRLTRDRSESNKTLTRLRELGISVFFIIDNMSTDDEEFTQLFTILTAIQEKELELAELKKKRKMSRK